MSLPIVIRSCPYQRQVIQGIFTRGNDQLWSRRICTSPCRTSTVWEPFRTGDQKYERKPHTFKEKLKLLKGGFKQLKHEFKLYGEELKEHFRMDPALIQPGDSSIQWKFDTPDVMDKFITTSDKEHNEGFSECEFVLNKDKKAVFRGTLCTTLPKGGVLRRTGYCAIQSKRIRKSFRREDYLDWYLYTHLIMRVRGDGRSYMINLRCEGTYDLTWHDTYHYVLYTRGGPYWQMVKIPFSKFFMGSKGRIQDKQSPIPLATVTHFGLICADKVNGPFNLEIDYVGVHCDPTHTETFAYEMYEAPPYTAGV